jgi:hypothetical protein
MVRCREVLACLCAIAFLAVATPAQFPGMQGPPAMRGVFSPVVGSGAAYQLTDKKGEKMDMEIYIVGQETQQGQPGYWMETAMQTRQGQMVSKTLVAKKGTDTAVLRMIMQAPGQEPMEFSMEMMGMMNRGVQKQAQRADVREGATRVGTETIEVPAGKFSCEHYKTSEGDDIWISEKVAPWGMVKFTGKDSSMVLQRTITGATTRITGTPRKFDPSEMMRRPGN